MSHRAKRRRFAILGALHENGPLYTWDLHQGLGIRPHSLYADLGFLELGGLIVGELEKDCGCTDHPPRLRFRVTTPEERADKTRRRRVLPDAEAVIARPKTRRAFFPRPEMS